MIISASAARAQLFPLIEQVNQDQAPVTITSNAGNAVLVSESEWESLLETAFILRTASNRSHIEKSIAQLKSGKGVKQPFTDGQTLGQLLELAQVRAVKVTKKAAKTKVAKKKTATR
jgi:antitoxin YefM